VTNIEGEAITWTYDATPGVVDVLVMNSAGFLYAGYALRVCLKAVPLPYLEVHMTNIERREMKSVTTTECIGMISGLGINSYRHVLCAVKDIGLQI
jgi:3-dehydroquinate dehydratase-2